MTDEPMPPGLWQETRQAAEAWKQGRGREPAGSGPALAGQVLILPELGEPRLAWAVLRREQGKDERLLLVTADVNPLVGSGDVAVNDPGLGPLTLRCRFTVWVSERKLGATALLGTLPPEALSRADSRLQAIEDGQPMGTFSEQETEEDPEYQDWIEDVVRPAVRKLESQAGIDAPSPLPFPAPRPIEPLASRREMWVRWAAVLAFVGLGVGSGWLWVRQEQKIAGLQASIKAAGAAHRQATAELEARRADLEAQYQARLRKAGEDRALLELEHRARLQELETKLAKLRQATDVKNPWIATLGPAAVQRGPARIEIGPEASHLVLLLPVDDDPAGTKFEIEVSDRDSGRQVFLQKGLQSDDLGEVRLGLPTALVPPGDYRLRLFRKDGAKLHLVREHLIEIEEVAR